MARRSYDADATFVGPDLYPDLRRPTEGSLKRFQDISCPDLFGPFQQTPTEKQEPKRLHPVSTIHRVKSAAEPIVPNCFPTTGTDVDPVSFASVPFAPN